MEINLSIVLMAMVNFFVLLFIVQKFLYAPVLAMLIARQNHVERILQEADLAKEEAEKLKKDYEVTLKDAHKEAKEILANANKIGENEREKILSEAKVEILRLNERAKTELAREKMEAFTSLKKEVAELAIGASEVILGREVKESDHKDAIEAYLAKRVGG